MARGQYHRNPDAPRDDIPVALTRDAALKMARADATIRAIMPEATDEPPKHLAKSFTAVLVIDFPEPVGYFAVTDLIDKVMEQAGIPVTLAAYCETEGAPS